MPIEKITAAQFQASIRDAITRRNDSYDVTIGPIPDTMIVPQAEVLELQNDRVRKLSLLVSLLNADEFTGEFESDLDGIVFNEGMLRGTGSQASTTLTFYRFAEPTSDVRVQRGYPIATTPDTSTGQSIVFVTTEERTLAAATASSFFNFETERYELSVPAVAVIAGTSGRVGPNRLTRFLRPSTGFDGVTNTASTSGGLSEESNDELIERYLLAIRGREIATAAGIERIALSDFQDIEDLLVVYGSDTLLVRAGTDAGAVDAYVKGSRLTSVEDEVHEFAGIGQLIPVELPPLVSVSGVVVGGTTYLEDDDYEVVFDTSGVAGSAREESGIRFLGGGTNAAEGIVVGTAVLISYTYDALMRQLQSGFETDETDAFGSDLLWRRGVERAIALEADLRVGSGFNTTTVLAAVNAAVLDYIAGLGLGADVERSDIQGVVRQISGVDNFIFTRSTFLEDPSGVADILIASNEYASLASADLLVTLL